VSDFAAEVRAADRAAYLATLFLPETVRPAVFALRAYGIELDRIVLRAREPLAAEVRLQWWRDAIRDEGYGEGADIPLILSLREAMAAYGWPADTLAAMSEARIHDLYTDPFETLDAFDLYAGEAFSAPLQLAAMALATTAAGPEPAATVARSAATAAGYGGVALAAADAALTESDRFLAGRTRIARTLWQDAGLDDLEAALSAGERPAAFASAHRALIAHGRAADAAFRGSLAAVNPVVRGALLPAFAARPLLAAAAARPLAPQRPGPLRQQWRIWRDARWLGRLGTS